MQHRQRRPKPSVQPAGEADAATRWAAHLDRIASRRPTTASFGTASAAKWDARVAKASRRPKG